MLQSQSIHNNVGNYTDVNLKHTWPSEVRVKLSAHTEMGFVAFTVN